MAHGQLSGKRYLIIHIIDFRDMSNRMAFCLGSGVDSVLWAKFSLFPVESAVRLFIHVDIEASLFHISIARNIVRI